MGSPRRKMAWDSLIERCLWAMLDDHVWTAKLWLWITVIGSQRHVSALL